jgi:integrase
VTDLKNQHLLNRGGRWVYQRRVPTRLVPILGKPFIKKALGTSDVVEARRLRNVEDVLTDALFASAEKSGSAPALTMSLEELTEHLRQHVEKFDKRNAASLIQNPPQDPHDLAERIKDADEDLSILRTPGDPRQDEWVSFAVDRLLSEAGATLTDKDTIATFAELVRRSLMELQLRKLDRYQDVYGIKFHDSLFDPARPSSVTFGELADMYVAAKLKEFAANGIRQKSADRTKSAVVYLKEVMGAGTPLAQIDYDAIQRARELVAQTPSNRHKVYPGKPLLTQIDRAKNDGKPLLSPPTQSFYLDVLRDLLGLAVPKKLLPSNPALGVKPLVVDRTPQHLKRLPWTPEQIVGFFAGSFYRSCAPDAAQPYTMPDRSWRFWVPLLMLFSGARPGEIMQLETCDLKTTATGVWYLDLRDDPETGKAKRLKNEYSRRRIPLHPELVKLGFVSFVEERRKAKDGPLLFNNVKPDRYGSLSTGVSKAFHRTFLKQDVKLSDKQVLYSLRHNVRDALRRAKAPDETLEFLTGWSQGGSPVSSDYGDLSDPAHHIEYVERIAYEGLDLSFLYPAGTDFPGGS